MGKKIFLLAIALFVAACGGAATGETTVSASAPKLDLKIEGKDSTFAQKSGGIYKGTKTFTDKEGKISKANSSYIVVADFEMDMSKPGWMRSPLTAPEQTRVLIQLIGEEGSEEKSDIKVGTYKTDPTGKFMKVDSLTIYKFSDGKQVETDFETMMSTSTIKGEVRITKSSAEELSGEIDITEGDKSVKGTFTAKIPTKK